MGGIPIATLRPNGSGGVNVFYVHTDHLNTPRRISRPADNVILWRWDSDPFGTTAANEDPDGDTNLFAYSLRFPGQYFDAESGLHYNYLRDGYDSAVGRYTQSDPIGLKAGINTYGYVFQNPLAFSDPRGLEVHRDENNYCWDGVGIKCVNKKLPPTERIPPQQPKDPTQPACVTDKAHCAKSWPTAESCALCCTRMAGLTGPCKLGPQWQGQCIAECADRMQCTIDGSGGSADPYLDSR